MSNLVDPPANEDEKLINKVWDRLNDADKENLLASASSHNEIKNAIHTLLIEHTKGGHAETYTSKEIVRDIAAMLKKQKTVQDQPVPNPNPLNYAGRYKGYQPRSSFRKSSQDGPDTSPPKDFSRN